MIISLVKTASDLESYACEYEISCGNVEQLLRPTFEMYKLTPPQLPMPVPLTAYPLDFRAPEGNNLVVIENLSADHVFLHTLILPCLLRIASQM